MIKHEEHTFNVELAVSPTGGRSRSSEAVSTTTTPTPSNHRPQPQPPMSHNFPILSSPSTLSIMSILAIIALFLPIPTFAQSPITPTTSARDEMKYIWDVFSGTGSVAREVNKQGKQKEYTVIEFDINHKSSDYSNVIKINQDITINKRRYL